MSIVCAGSRIDEERNALVPDRDVESIKVAVGCCSKMTQRGQIPSQEPEARFQHRDSRVLIATPGADFVRMRRQAKSNFWGRLRNCAEPKCEGGALLSDKPATPFRDHCRFRG